jgi:hypothetical protein
MKKFPLKFIQVSWVAEGIALLIFTMLATSMLSPDRIALWIQILPILVGLILAQGTCAGGGPLLSDRINKPKGDKSE